MGVSMLIDDEASYLGVDRWQCYNYEFQHLLYVEGGCNESYNESNNNQMWKEILTLDIYCIVKKISQIVKVGNNIFM